MTFGMADCMHSVNIASSSEWFGLSSENSSGYLSVASRGDFEHNMGFLFLWLLSTGEDNGVPHVSNLWDDDSGFFANRMLFVGSGGICLACEKKKQRERRKTIQVDLTTFENFLTWMIKYWTHTLPDWIHSSNIFSSSPERLVLSSNKSFLWQSFSSDLSCSIVSMSSCTLGIERAERLDWDPTGEISAGVSSVQYTCTVSEATISIDVLVFDVLTVASTGDACGSDLLGIEFLGYDTKILGSDCADFCELSVFNDCLYLQTHQRKRQLVREKKLNK